ncbi:transporter substrate-binding domain-containing protein [Terasakiella sp. A23]|uniref:substrate-binding periplasmic protein n=1 Tax=Terasakiella sp. FCG-A23 TaxID=3080561 RepID=UPI00295367CC|nr:transporter substrate-binding domain-containing protein [Terasakiella sp. A23]MDV7338917.1 transporter substrate-binding domain-containing protein [Terasakiella sp. A23]
MKVRTIFLTCLLVASVVFPLHQAKAGDVITVGFKAGKAPYVIPTKPFQDSDFDMSKDLGIEVEIVKEVFALSGKTVKPVYMNYKRMESELLNGKIQMGSNLHKGVEGVFYADNHVRLFDHFVYPSNGKVKVHSFADMVGKRVLSFQNATKFLGDDYRAAVKTAKSYREIDDQEKQVKAIAQDRADVVLMDISIFKYFAKKHGNADQAFNFSPMFPSPFFFSSGFSDEALRNEFAAGLQKLKDSGKYDEIYSKYTD